MPTDGAAKRPAADDQPLAELRAILLGPDREAWESMRQRLDNPARRAEDIASVLADAVRLRSDAKLRRALQPLLEEALQLSVQSNPRMLADALFPIFGKAIRRAITSELDGMLQSLSQTLEQRFSWRSLRWRWEAIRTGKSYAEIVLLRSLLYRVEQVFLIHRKTGLLLQYAAVDTAEAKDPDMVSGMLTAIQDFVHDSVSGTEGENLETVRMGDIGVVLTYGPDAILSGFVRGVPPRNLSRVFQDTLDAIERQKTQQLHEFTGDTSQFDSCRPQLEACLVGQGKPERKAVSRMAGALLFGVPALVIIALAAWWIYASAMERRWSNFAHRLGSEPGIVLTGYEKRGGTHYISGLRDPMAADPTSLLAADGLSAANATFHFEEYHSLDPRFAAQRRLVELKAELERRAFRFPTGSSVIPPEQRFLLDDVAAQVLSLIRAGAALGESLRVEVRGNHDPAGTEQLNSALARSRADNVEAALVALGVPAARLTAVPEDKDRETCTAVKEEERLFCRSASFRVIGAPPTEPRP
jgi:outer membrane protein OmpA-like peptidoglycan-associated protein